MQSVSDLIRKNYLETFESVAVYRTTDDKLNRFIEAMFGHEFELVADQELSNDSSWTTEVGRKHPLDDYDLKEIDKFVSEGKYNQIAYQLMQYMYEKGMITEGEYIVDVSW
ncbi:MAG: hypothetical protein ACYSW6_09070 [Planctomycetota bacterium]|jgi:hypothetical protein